MTHISKRNLKLRELDKLEFELIKSFERASKEEKTRQVFSEFFTRTEKVMLAKRLAVIAMLSKGVSSHMIAEALQMSPSTTSRIETNFEKSRYTNIVKHGLGKKDIWEILEKILFVGGIMPPKAGGSRWRNFNKAARRERLQQS